MRVADLHRTQESGELLPLVIAFDLDRRIPTMVRIRQVIEIGEVTSLVRVCTDKGISLLLTLSHHLLTYDGRLCRADKLRPGMRLRKLSRSSIPERSDRRVIYNRLNGSGEYQARWMYEQVTGPIPEDMHVHHVTEDPTDDRVSKLDLVPKKDHVTQHSQGASNPRFLDCDMATFLRVYDYIMAHGRPRGGKVSLTLARWNTAVYQMGLKGQVPLANPKGGGRIQGRPWSDFAKEVEEAACAVNDRVTSIEIVERDSCVGLFTFELVEGIFPFVSDGCQLHAIAVAWSGTSTGKSYRRDRSRRYEDRPPVRRIRI
jgi:hypothetical protein